MDDLEWVIRDLKSDLKAAKAEIGQLNRLNRIVDHEREGIWCSE